MAYIKLENVGLNFPLISANRMSLRRTLADMALQRRFVWGRNSASLVRALDNIGLEIKDGSRVGLVGPNGAGKTTLLKLIANIYEPTNGTLQVEGDLGYLFDMQLGIDDEASGYENIFLKYYAKGMRKREIEKVADNVAAFADIGEFIHMPVHTYSAGMRARLTFAIETEFAPSILLIDEVFGAGDSRFVKKSTERMDSIVEKSRILIFASHNNHLLIDVCDTGIYMKKGKIILYDEIKDVSKCYENDQ